MRTIPFLFMFICASIVCVSQNNGPFRGDTSSYKYAVTVAPTIFPFSIGIQPGFQFEIGNKFDLISEVAFSSTKEAKDYDRVKIFKIVSELKYYPSNGIAGKYFSFQSGFINRNFITKDSGWYFKDTATLGYSRADIKSPVTFVALKWGREIDYGKRIVFDFFMGLGMRYVHTDYNADGVHLRKRPGGPGDDIFEIFGNAWVYERNYIKLHGTAGLRMGIRL